MPPIKYIYMTAGLTMPQFVQTEQQKELIEYAISVVKDNVTETFGNTNGNGNALYEVVKEWAEQKKSRSG